MLLFLLVCVPLCIGFSLHTSTTPATPDQGCMVMNGTKSAYRIATFAFNTVSLKVSCCVVGYDVILWDRKIIGSEWKPYPFDNSSSTLLDRNKTLVLHTATKKDKGDYRCTAYNFTGNQSSTLITSIRLTREPPRNCSTCLGPPPKMCINDNEMATSRCQGDFIENDPLFVDISWIEIKNDIPYEINDSRITFDKRGTVVTMTIDHIISKDIGRTFMCIVSSTASDSSKSFQVRLQDCDTTMELDNASLVGVSIGVVLLMLIVIVVFLVVMFCCRVQIRRTFPSTYYKVFGGTNPFLPNGKEFHALIHHTGEEGTIPMDLEKEIKASGEYRIRVTDIPDDGSQPTTRMQVLENAARKSATLILIAPTYQEEQGQDGEGMKMVPTSHGIGTHWEDEDGQLSSLLRNYFSEINSMLEGYFTDAQKNTVTVIIPHRTQVRELPNELRGFKYVIFGEPGSAERRSCIKYLQMRMPLPK